MVGDPFELIEFEISGPDVIQILRLENGVHKFKRKSLNTSNAVAGLTYNCQVHTRPILTKVGVKIHEFYYQNRIFIESK